MQFGCLSFDLQADVFGVAAEFRGIHCLGGGGQGLVVSWCLGTELIAQRVGAAWQSADEEIHGLVAGFHVGAESAARDVPHLPTGGGRDACGVDLGPELIEVFLRNKRYELARWEAHQNRLTAWEIEEYAEAL